MRLNRLFTQIFLVFALVMIVCVGVSGWFVMKFSGNIVTRKICDGDRNFAGRIAQEIEAEVASVKPTLTLLAQTPELRLMEAKKVSVGADRVRRAFPEITSVYVADMEGKQIYRTGTGQLKNVSSMRSFQVAKGGDKFFSDIYLKPTTLEPMQTITLPIIDSGTVVGVLSADVSFGRIMRSFMGVSVGEDGNVIVVADDGRVIAHTHIEQVQGVDLSRLPIVKAVLAGEAGTMKGYTDELGREVLGTYMPISELGWGVLIQRPIANMYTEVRQLRTAIIWVVMASVLLVLPAGWLMSRQIARPIGQIASASKRVAQGDLSTPVDVKSSNEVGLLAHSFNQMMMSLKKARDELQQWGEDLEQSRNALRESEDRYRSLVENIDFGVTMVDKDFKITMINAVLGRWFNKPIREFIGKKCFKEFENRQAVCQHCPGVKAMANGQPHQVETEGVRDDGSHIPALVHAFPLFNPDGSAKGFIEVIENITERKRMEQEKANLEEQLRQSQKMEAIGQLAGGIAHDFNNLLTIIKGYSQLSLLELKEGDPLSQNIEEIQKASERASNLTRQILAFSRRQMMEMKVLDLNTLLRDLEKMLYRVIGEDIELVTFLAEDLGRVKTDPGQIEQVIMNLAVNARDAMPSGGKLTIETANVELDEEYAHRHIAVRPGRYVMLSLIDTGVGMTPEVKERVFEPFFSTKEKGKGTGLGLSTVYGIVKQSGGNIWVYSEPEKGTTFKVYLPRVDEPLEEDWEKIAGEELPRGSETILVVEDGEEVRKLAVRILRQQGYRVLEASQGLDGFLICGEHEGPIHLLLTDVVMPKVSGRELADRIVSIRPEIKVLYMSGYTDNAIAHHGVLEKGVNYIQKPFTVEGLAKKVRRVLDKDSKPAV